MNTSSSTAKEYSMSYCAKNEERRTENGEPRTERTNGQGNQEPKELTNKDRNSPSPVPKATGEGVRARIRRPTPRTAAPPPPHEFHRRFEGAYPAQPAPCECRPVRASRSVASWRGRGADR